MTHLKITAAAILGLLLAAAAAPRCSADTGPISKNSLKGLPGVGVAVIPLTPDVEKAGLTRDQLTTDVELLLRQSGIRVLTEEEWLKTPGMPCLSVDVTAIPQANLLLFSVNVQLEQAVKLARNPVAVQPAFTWSIAFLGLRPADGVRQAVRDDVDAFANDFLSVNPKR